MKTLLTAVLFFTVTALSSSALATPHAGAEKATSTPGNYPAETLLDTSQDVLGAQLTYPDCKPRIVTKTISLAPGQTGSEHQHLTPLFAYVLNGEVSVSYKTGVVKVYRAGEAFMEAEHVVHHGFNASDTVATLLAVYMLCAE
jgi:quercetin dioxygenase-like cupin family protein